MRRFSPAATSRRWRIARLLHHDVDVLLLDEPTRGIDVGSKAQIYHLIDARRSRQGGPLVSSYLPSCSAFAIASPSCAAESSDPARAVGLPSTRCSWKRRAHEEAARDNRRPARSSRWSSSTSCSCTLPPDTFARPQLGHDGAATVVVGSPRRG